MSVLPPPSTTPPSHDPDRTPGGPPPGDPPTCPGAWPWSPEAPESRVRISGSEELIAAVPVLLGFHPEDSLVLVGMAGPELRGRVGLTLRVDLPRRADTHHVCTGAVSALAGTSPARAVAVVVAPGRAVRRDVAASARRALLRAGIEPLAVLWTAGTRHGDAWSCYDLPGQRCRCSGTVPDPSATPAAAAAVLRGRRVLPDREAVAAQLEGDERDLARRARLRSAALARRGPGAAGSDDPPPVEPPGRPDTGPPGADLLERCVRAAADGVLTVDDTLALEFCVAFGDGRFRDEAVRRCLGPDAPHVEQLWAVLCRSLPAPERADAAALLATCALLRGDGALATLATERALDDRPDHGLAAVVDASVRSAVGSGASRWPYPGPDGLRTLLRTAHLDLDGAAGSRTGRSPGGAGETVR